MNETQSDNSGTGAEQSQPALTASQMLKTAREKRGLSQKDVADQLFLSTAFIRYIDDGEFDKIPKPAFIKGYLRSYAHTVNLPAEDVVAAYQHDLDEAESAIDVRDVAEDSLGSSNFTGPVLTTGIAGLVGLIALVALVWWLVREDPATEREPAVTERQEAPGAEAVAPANQQETGVSMPERVVGDASGEPAKDAGGEETGDDGIADTTVTETETETTGGPADTGEEVAEPASEDTSTVVQTDAGSNGGEEAAPALDDSGPQKEVNIDRVVDGETRYVNVDAGGESEMTLTFSDDCWVEITDGDGVTVYADLNRSGDVLTISGVSPFEVLLGRATSVALSFNGEEVNLEPHITSDKTARLSVGE